MRCGDICDRHAIHASTFLRRHCVLDPDLPAFQDIQTPALVLDSGALARNISGMAAFAKAHDIGLRPHAKTHKSPRIAQLQLEAGALGISCATVAEIEAFAKAGIPGLLLTSPVADRAKLERLARIARETEISIVVDHADQVDVLGELLGEGSRPLQVLVDIDVGQHRTGVCDVASTLALAQLIRTTPGMRFGGIQGFAGHVQHLIDADERKAAAAVVCGILDDHLRVLADAKIDAAIVTGSGTGAALMRPAPILNCRSAPTCSWMPITAGCNAKAAAPCPMNPACLSSPP
jgi:D-serine deaminase-like pyridoxal phosphate-dependent protein